MNNGFQTPIFFFTFSLQLAFKAFPRRERKSSVYFRAVLIERRIQSNSRCFGFVFLSAAIVKKHAPLSQPIRSKTKTNRDLLARVFPRLTPVACICCEF